VSGFQPGRQQQWRPDIIISSDGAVFNPEQSPAICTSRQRQPGFARRLLPQDLSAPINSLTLPTRLSVSHFSIPRAISCEAAGVKKLAVPT